MYLFMYLLCVSLCVSTFVSSSLFRNFMSPQVSMSVFIFRCVLALVWEGVGALGGGGGGVEGVGGGA